MLVHRSLELYPYPHLEQYGLGNKDEYEKLNMESGRPPGDGFSKLCGHDIFFYLQRQHFNFSESASYVDLKQRTYKTVPPSFY